MQCTYQCILFLLADWPSSMVTATWWITSASLSSTTSCRVSSTSTPQDRRGAAASMPAVVLVCLYVSVLTVYSCRALAFPYRGALSIHVLFLLSHSDSLGLRVYSIAPDSSVCTDFFHQRDSLDCVTWSGKRPMGGMEKEGERERMGFESNCSCGRGKTMERWNLTCCNVGLCWLIQCWYFPQEHAWIFLVSFFFFFFIFLWRMRASLAYVDCSLLWQCVLSIDAFHHFPHFLLSAVIVGKLDCCGVAVAPVVTTAGSCLQCVLMHTCTLFCTLIYTSFSLWKKKKHFSQRCSLLA